MRIKIGFSIGLFPKPLKIVVAIIVIEFLASFVGIQPFKTAELPLRIKVGFAAAMGLISAVPKQLG